MKGRHIMIALMLLGLLIALAILSILGWTADSRDVKQTLWPLERARPDPPSIAPIRDDQSPRAVRSHAAPKKDRVGPTQQITRGSS
jgi:hypothetical protein